MKERKLEKEYQDYLREYRREHGFESPLTYENWVEQKAEKSSFGSGARISKEAKQIKLFGGKKEFKYRNIHKLKSSSSWIVVLLRSLRAGKCVACGAPIKSLDEAELILQYPEKAASIGLITENEAQAIWDLKQKEVLESSEEIQGLFPEKPAKPEALPSKRVKPSKSRGLLFYIMTRNAH